VRSQVPQIELATARAANIDRGVFETLLVVDGRAVGARRHIERMRASLLALYGVTLPAGVEAVLAESAAGHALARLRMEAVVAPPAAPGAPGAPAPPGPPEIRVTVTPIGPAVVLPSDEAAVVTVGVRDGAGPHKTIDRSWFEQIEALAGEGVRPLLVASSGALLESTRANVFLMRDGVLSTPPASGSILAGTVRAVVAEHAWQLGIPLREMPLTLEHFEQADIVLLTGSVRLLERARWRRASAASTRAADRLAGALAADAGL
jgi:para-aminobenzoate synthetase / 4-amino-4-deoxychorismate lyase